MRVAAVVERPFGSELAADYPRVANYITNPRFETNTTSWAYGGTAGGAIARDTAVFDEGIASLRADMPLTGAASDRAEYAITLTSGEAYTLRARLRATSGFGYRLWVADGVSTILGQSTGTGDGAFHDFEVQFTATANNTHKMRFGRTATSAAFSVWADKVQLIRVSDGAVVAYADGSMMGYGWSGTADASTTLEQGWLEVADPTDFEEEGGSLKIGAEIIPYLSADEDTGLISLFRAVNGIRNSNFEVDLSRWSSASTGTTTRTRDVTDAWAGIASQKCVTDGTAAGQGALYNDSNAGVRVDPGETWVASGYFKQAAGGMTSAISIEYKTAADVSLGVQVGPSVVLAAGRWQRLSAVAIAPAGAYKAYIRFINVNASVVTFFLDACMFHQGSEPLEFLDGDVVNTYLTEEPVYVYPLSTERVALLTEGDQVLDDEDTMEARVPHALYDKLPAGLRDITDGEAVAAEFDGDELVISDVLGQEPSVDGSFIQPDTFDIPPSDGLAPTASPTPVVNGGVSTLLVSWPTISNADLVVYEVHVSTSSGFTPGAGTYVGETASTLYLVRTLNGGGTPAYGTTYYVKIVARDTDGSAPAGAEASGSPAQINSPDLAVNSVIAGKIAANAVTAGTLETVLQLTSALMAGTPSAQRVEIGYGTTGGVVDPSFIGVRAFGPDGTTATFRVDAITGEVYVKGRVDFGTASRLTADDILELKQQPAGVSFLDGAIVQSSSAGIAVNTTGSASWTGPTTKGNLLVLAVVIDGNDGSTAPTVTTPAGWTSVGTVQITAAGLRLHLFKIENAASRSGAQSVTWSGAAPASLTLLELSGVAVQDVALATNSGTGSPASTGTTATTTQADGYQLGFLVTDSDTLPNKVLTSPSGGFVQQLTADVPSSPTIYAARLYVYSLNVSATGTASMSATQSASDEWLGAMLTFKTKALAVDPPDTDRLRLYGLDVGGNAKPHVMDEAGNDGALVLGKAGEIWKFEYLTGTLNMASRLAHSGGSETLTLTGAVIGDLVVSLRPVDVTDMRTFLIEPEPVVTVANQVQLVVFNSDSATRDPLSTTFHVILLHRA